MREFDNCLERLRAALDVTPKRAEEICREVRSHLEARTRELAATGLDEDAAAREAVRGFGEPRRMAAQLTRANESHHRANRVRALLGFMIVFTGMLTVNLFWQVPSFEGDVRVSRETPAIELLVTYTGLPLASAQSLFRFLVIVPVAVLAGMLAGRRRWWVAGAPPLLWLVLLIPLVVWSSRQGIPSVTLQDLGIPLALLHVLAMAGCGYLGSRALRWRRGTWFMGMISGGYVALTTLAISCTMFTAISDGMPGSIWWGVILAGELSVLVLGALAYRAYRNSQVSA
jgi:hypothetical protein